VTGSVGVQVVGLQISGQAKRIGRVSHGFVEINDPVEGSTVAYPLVDQPTSYFVIGGVVTVTFEGHDGGAIDKNTLGMRRVNELLVGVNQVVGRLCSVGRVPQIVHPFENDGPFHTGLVEDIPFKPADTGWAQAITQHTVTADTHIQDTDLAGLRLLEQAFRENICPTVLLVSNGASPVCDGITQDGYGLCFFRSPNLKGVDHIPMFGTDSLGKIRRGG